MPRFPVLIVGSTGVFGARVAALLARRPASIALILGGRRRPALDAQAAALARETGRAPAVAVLDAEAVRGEDLFAIGAALVINASGPFQDASYTLARAAIAAGCHYVDLADARAFVAGFPALDADAQAAGVLAVSGASSVPGLSSAAVAHLRNTFADVETIEIAISPGHSFDPGRATVAAVLGGVGQPMRVLADGRWQTVHGWQGLTRGDFGAAGRRWLGDVDVPDLDLFAAQVPGVRSVRFRAGLEVSALHLGLWAASWLVRGRLVPSLAPLAPLLLSVKRRLGALGSDRGGMLVTLGGTGRDGQAKAVTWRLVARSGHGPYVPALTSVALARRLASGVEQRRGAMACSHFVPLADILAEADGLDIATEVIEKPLPR